MKNEKKELEQILKNIKFPDYFAYADKLLRNRENGEAEAEELRYRVTEFEKTFKEKWNNVCEKHKVNHCFALPLNVYNKTIKELTLEKKKFYAWLLDKIKFWISHHIGELEHKENPYIYALKAFSGKYGFR